MREALEAQAKLGASLHSGARCGQTCSRDSQIISAIVGRSGAAAVRSELERLRRLRSQTLAVRPMTGDLT